MAGWVALIEVLYRINIASMRALVTGGDHTEGYLFIYIMVGFDDLIPQATPSLSSWSQRASWYTKILTGLAVANEQSIAAVPSNNHASRDHDEAQQAASHGEERDNHQSLLSPKIYTTLDPFSMLLDGVSGYERSRFQICEHHNHLRWDTQLTAPGSILVSKFLAGNGGQSELLRLFCHELSHVEALPRWETVVLHTR